MRKLSPCRAGRRERGAVSVELALAMPVVVLLILGGVYLGRALGTRHRLADAVGFATRAAAISRTTDATTVRTLVLNRLGTAAVQCSGILIDSKVVPSVAGTSRLEVTGKCTLAPAFGSALLGFVISDVTVSAAMPF